MAIIDDDMKEESLCSADLNSLLSHVNEEDISPDDIAWADSCLNKDVDAVDGDWSSIKDALLEILSSHQDPPANSTVILSSMQLGADENFQFTDNLTSMEFESGFNEDEDFIDDDFEEIESIDVSEDDEDNLVLRNKRGRVRGQVLNAFLPNYSEEVKGEDLDSNLTSNLTMHEVDISSEDIFRVWDLGVTEEQDDFAKQLNKALAAVPPEIESFTSNSAGLKDLMHASVDDLIAGIGDLSLKQ